jgi:hypothetical protein
MISAMKSQKGFLVITIILFFAAILFSCERQNNETEATGSIKFSVSLPSMQSVKSVANNPDSSGTMLQLLVTIADDNGKEIFADTLLPLYSFGTGWISKEIRIRAGNYQLTKFIVVDASGKVVYATPLENAPLAYLCNDPLPFRFTITGGQTSSIVPEVLAVGNSTPGQFGYASFGLLVVNPLEFYTVCILDNPLIMAPVVFTTANLTVYSSDGWNHQFKLEAAVNDIVIRGGSDIYTFVLEKEGYSPQKFQITAKELLATNKENPFILRIPFENYRTVVIQPGPDSGKDAMISNLEPDKNFGGHKYFEATFLSEPILTVMRSNRSLIAFNLDTIPKSAIVKSVVMRLMYDIPIPYDYNYATDSLPVTSAAWYGGVLQQIIEPWEEDKVTWNTQPKTIETGQVYIAPFIKNANFIDIDVTRLIYPITASALPNYGMLFRLWPDNKFPGFRFASGDYAEPKMRPQLIITFTL